ncbi:MAG: hypothetical protein WC415_06120 [Patescibacteria group bacterium]|jgi:hypothetical protein
MQNDNQITKAVDNDEIKTVHNRCCASASNLILNLTSKRKIKKLDFNSFKGTFTHLFLLTSNRRELENEQLVSSIKDWVFTDSITPNATFAKEGIDLFFEYQKLIRSLKIINDK